MATLKLLAIKQAAKVERSVRKKDELYEHAGLEEPFRAFVGWPLPYFEGVTTLSCCLFQGEGDTSE